MNYQVHLFAAVLVISNCLSLAVAEDFDIKPLQDDIVKTVDKVTPAVVSIGSGGSLFSGVIVSKDGHVLSAGHAVNPGARYRIRLPDGRRFNGIGKGVNPRADCALILITEKVDDLPFVQMGDSSEVVTNQPCLSISFPGGQGTRGVPVVRFGRVVRPRQWSGMLQSSALMEPGDSGGALFDMDGRVIGIHSRIGESMSRNYEVPVDVYKGFWNELNRESSFTTIGPPSPRLGFRGSERRSGPGVVVDSIVRRSLADKHGILAKDIIRSIYGQAVNSINDVRQALESARDEGADEIVVQVVREEEEVDIKVPFDVEREAAPKVELPVYEEQEFSKPTAIRELANLPRQFTEIESQLDDGCLIVESKSGEGESLRIAATKISGTKLLVSKSSVVGEYPTAEHDSEEWKLEVIARDSNNDLVLLRAPETHEVGIELAEVDTTAPGIGSFLISPDSRSNGLISVISTRSFRSRKQASRGFLGVIPTTFERNRGALLTEITKDQAASRAGLEVGDVVTKMDSTVIKTQFDMRNFLATVDPNATIIAQVLRGEEELTKTITLGAFPSFSSHAADRMEKSGRRDGFELVIPHDADLRPSQCGGPLYDLEGNFVGINIARNSRVRSYAIPASIVKEFVDQNRP